VIVILERILSWLEKNLPQILIAFGIGYNQGSKDKAELEKKLLDEEILRKKQANKNEVKDKYADISDTDIVRSLAHKNKKK